MGYIKDMSRKRLNEVEVLRPLAVLLVVILHSFTVYWGKWQAPEGFVHITAYKWIAASSFSFTMELFVMLSGYIFGFQLIKLKREYTMKSLLMNKLNRLILPSLIFGVVYALIFYWNRDFFKAIYSILNGAGHLWFLQMLFWCFLMGFAVYKAQIKESAKLALLAVAVCLSLIHFPFRIDKALYYLFFFYLGISLMRNQDVCRRLSRNTGLLIVLVAVYLTAFISYELLMPSVKLIKTYWIFTYSLSGTLFFFFLAYRLLENRTSVSPNIIFCSSISFGVYLFHQIILEVIYYKTSLPVVIGPYWLPWAALAFTLISSVLLVMLFRKLNLKFLSI